MAPGIVASGVIAVLCLDLAQLPWLQAHGLSALTLAILLGMAIGNTVYHHIAPLAGPGVAFAKTWLLRTGVVLYGLRLTGQDIAHVGISGIAIDALVVVSTFMLATWAGQRWFGIDRKTALLIAAGNSICGAAAVMAAEPIVKARSEQVTVAIATVVVFGTIAIFLYPFLWELNNSWHVIGGGTYGFGLYTGSTVHEVAQVIAAARPLGQEAGDAAVIAKMVRVMMLAPVLLTLAWWLAREERAASHGKAPKIAVPWFALAFIGAVAFNSTGIVPATLRNPINTLDTALLSAAMAALGLTTHVSAIRKAGTKPLLLALILFAWLIIAGAVFNHALGSA
jgi:uncharacterized integral membrane protein (TIGR00698 family)